MLFADHDWPPEEPRPWAKRSPDVPTFPYAFRKESVTRLVLRALVSLGAVIGCVAAACLVGPVAAAQAYIVNLNPCNGSALSQPFAPWLDPAFYELAPGGDFESSAWSLAGGAQLVPGSEPYAATGALGSRSLWLPAGSSALSPSTCVDAGYPTIRFFMAGTGSVAVTVVDGNLDIPAGVAVASGGWLPTPVMVTSSPLLAALAGGTGQVSLRLTALSGKPYVDDVFVDPWNRS